MNNKKYDVVVVGGGMSGVAAAYSLAKQGIKTLLVERYGFLGGMATAGKVNHWMRYWINEYKEENIINKGFFYKVNKKLSETGDLIEPGIFNEEMLKIVLEDLILEAGVKLLYHSILVGVKKEKNKITEIILGSKNGIFNIEADYFIDATGDADLINFSNFEYEIGREKDNLCQPMTLCFRIKNVKYDNIQKLKKKVNDFYTVLFKKGELLNKRGNVLFFENIDKSTIHFNSTRVNKKLPIDPFELTEAEIEGKKQVKELFFLLKNNIKEFQNGILVDMAPQIGVRESRRIIGHYTLTENDIASCRKFSNSIARGNYAIDVHSPDGEYTYLKYIQEGDYYTIPYSSCLPKNSENILVVGRPISSSHIAHGAIRVMPICSSIGEGVGTVLSYAIKNKKALNNINFNEIHKIMDKNDMKY